MLFIRLIGIELHGAFTSRAIGKMGQDMDSLMVNRVQKTPSMPFVLYKF